MSRLFLEVTDIRAERLQDITEEDAIEEGIELIDDGNSYGYKLYGKHAIKDMLGRNAVTGTEIESYQTLWQKINGVESWNNNLFVWVITFKIVECPQGFCKRTGLGVVGGFEKRPPGTAANALLMYKIR